MATQLKWQQSLVAMITIMGLQKTALADDCAYRMFEYGSVCVCNTTYCDWTPEPEVLPAGKYLLYTSSRAGSRLDQRTGSFLSSLDSDWTGEEINANQSVTFQKIYGFGGGVTDSACLNIKSLSEDAQLNLLKSYFSDDGIKYNMARVPLGGTDFSTHPYTYADEKGTPDLSNFDLSYEDTEYKIPLIKTASEMASDELNLVGSAWSAPTWMKTSHKISGIGFLKPEYLDSWAEYHLRFLDEYRKNNVTIWALTTGNEPIDGIVPNFFNSLGWNPLSHREWIGRYMGPKLRESEHNGTLLFGFDDQRVLLPWWITILMQDEECAKYIDGWAVHWYFDSFIPVEVLDDIHNDYSDKILLNTEASQFPGPGLPLSQKNQATYATLPLGSWDKAEYYANDIIDDLNHWVQGWMEWNLALDVEGGPSWWPSTLDSPIIVDKTKDEFYKQPMFYSIGHFSKFISRGSFRIELSHTSDIKSVGFKRPDGAVVIVLYNRRNETADISISDPERGVMALNLQEKSINTLIYW